MLYVGMTNDLQDAMRREKQITGWTRARKTDLIKERNPKWLDLSSDWFNPPQRGDSGTRR